MSIKVFHENFGVGQLINGMHSQPDHEGNIEFYDVMFEHGIEQTVPAEELEDLSEKLIGNQKKLDANHNGHLDAQDFKILRAKKKKLGEETELTEKLTKGMSAADIIHDFVHSDDPKFKGKSKEERQKMALGAYYSMHPEKSTKEEVEQVDELSKNALHLYLGKTNKMDRAELKKHGKHVDTAVDKIMGKGGKVPATEETELEEGRGRPPKEGSEAWKRQQAAKDAGQTAGQEPDEHPMQLVKKAADNTSGDYDYKHKNSKITKLGRVDARALQAHHNTKLKTADEKQDFAELIHHSPEGLAHALSIAMGKPVGKDPRPPIHPMSISKTRSESTEMTYEEALEILEQAYEMGLISETELMSYHIDEGAFTGIKGPSMDAQKQTNKNLSTFGQNYRAARSKNARADGLLDKNNKPTNESSNKFRSNPMAEIVNEGKMKKAIDFAKKIGKEMVNAANPSPAIRSSHAARGKGFAEESSVNALPATGHKRKDAVRKNTMPNDIPHDPEHAPKVPPANKKSLGSVKETVHTSDSRNRAVEDTIMGIMAQNRSVRGEAVHADHVRRGLVKENVTTEEGHFNTHMGYGAKEKAVEEAKKLSKSGKIVSVVGRDHPKREGETQIYQEYHVMHHPNVAQHEHWIKHYGIDRMHNAWDGSHSPGVHIHHFHKGVEIHGAANDTHKLPPFPFDGKKAVKSTQKTISQMTTAPKGYKPSTAANDN